MRPRFQSLLARIVSLQILAIGIAAALGAVVFYLLLHTVTDAYEQRLLRSHAAQIVAALTPQDGGWRLRLKPEDRALYERQASGIGFGVVDPSGRVLFYSGPHAQSLLSAAERSDETVYFETRHHGRRYYGASMPDRRGNQTAWIVVLQDLGHPDVVVDDIAKSLAPLAALLALPLLALLLAADIWIVRRALRPVVQASAVAEAIEPRRLEVRLPVADLPREIRPLATAVNRALDRLAAAFQAQREFTADAAHELRTPLTVLRLRIDALSDRKAARALRSDADAIGQVVDQLLEISRLEEDATLSDEVCDLARVAADAASALAPLAVARGVELELLTPAEAVMVRGRSAAFFHAVRNLIDNALVHAQSRVEISVLETGGVEVSDDGLGVPQSAEAHLFDRFWRADRRADGVGGLGLAIVAKIARAYGGEIEVGRSRMGGARFALIARTV